MADLIEKMFGDTGRTGLETEIKTWRELNKEVLYFSKLVKEMSGVKAVGGVRSDGNNAGGNGNQVKVRFEDIFTDVTRIANNTLITTLLGGADNFGAKLINGISEAMSLTNSLVSIIASIGNIASGGILSIFGFAKGGYTGDGGRNEPKGIVHGGEFVINKEATKQFYPLLELINGGSRNVSFGYASGGFVTPNAMTPNITVLVSTEFDKMKSYEVVYNGGKIARARGSNKL